MSRVYRNMIQHNGRGGRYGTRGRRGKCNNSKKKGTIGTVHSPIPKALRMVIKK